jgi:hypothetical protein
VLSTLIRPCVAPMVVLLIVGVPVPARLSAQDPFEIEVYGYRTAARAEWELDTHLNYIARGTRAFDGTVAPNEHQAHLAFELTRGLTDHLELAAYLLSAYRPGSGFEYAGARVRSRVRAPDAWRLPVGLSVAAELEFSPAAYDESAIGLEIRPIVERRVGRLLLDVNPVIERGLRAHGAARAGGWELEPSARLGFTVSPTLDLSFEYYGKLGGTAADRVHQLYPGVDLQLGEDFDLNLGVGFGLTSAGSRTVLKTRFEVPLGR